MNLGFALKQARKGAGIKQKVLADRLNITASYLSLIETNDKVPSLDILWGIAVELGVPLYKIIATAHEEEDMYPDQWIQLQTFLKFKL